MSELQLRTAEAGDAERLLEIYAPYVEKTAITFEDEVPSIGEFQARIKQTLKTYPYLVALKDGQIVGYAYAGPFKERAAYAHSVELSIYVELGQRHQHIGGFLYEAIENVLKKQGFINLNACIAAPIGEDPYLDDNSLRFHEHLGYQLVGRFHQCGYKFDRWYDMVWMEKMLGEHPVPAPAIIPYPELQENGL